MTLLGYTVCVTSPDAFSACTHVRRLLPSLVSLLALDTLLFRSCEPYSKSKTLAEMAAWDLVKSEESVGSLDLAVVNPGLIIGPTLSANVGTSLDICTQILDRKMPATPHLCINVVDVRDVAEAIVRAMVNNEQFWRCEAPMSALWQFYTSHCKLCLKTHQLSVASLRTWCFAPSLIVFKIPVMGPKIYTRDRREVRRTHSQRALVLHLSTASGNPLQHFLGRVWKCGWRADCPNTDVTGHSRACITV